MSARDTSTKAELIAAAQALAARLDRRPYTIRTYATATGFNQNQIRRHFGGWRALCVAAGLVPTEWRARLSDDAIFEGLRDICLAVGGVPSRTEFHRRIAFSGAVVARRFGTWAATLAKFLAWVRASDPGFVHRAALERTLAEARARKRKKRARSGARACGEPLGYGPLLHAPTCELGVVLAFGVLAAELGYAIETTTQEFPDCTAKRRVGRGRWEPVRAEFEFRAGNFFAHDHDIAGCEVIICWENDWPDCPIEVLELKSAIERLRRRAAGPVNARPRRRKKRGKVRRGRRAKRS